MSENTQNVVDFLGPFEHHLVIVNGRIVPFLVAHPQDGGKISLTLDHRFGLDLSVYDAQSVVPFLANAIAVALGFASFPASNEKPAPRSLFPKMHGITSPKTP